VAILSQRGGLDAASRTSGRCHVRSGRCSSLHRAALLPAAAATAAAPAAAAAPAPAPGAAAAATALEAAATAAAVSTAAAAATAAAATAAAATGTPATSSSPSTALVLQLTSEEGASLCSAARPSERSSERSFPSCASYKCPLLSKLCAQLHHLCRHCDCSAPLTEQLF
jgi:hypothetical protein